MLATLKLEEDVPTDCPNEQERLVQVLTRTKKVDPIMHNVAKGAIEQVKNRHAYEGNIVKDSGKAHYGDEYAKGEQHGFPGFGHNFKNNVVTGSNSHASYGDRFGMPDTHERRKS